MKNTELNKSQITELNPVAHSVPQIEMKVYNELAENPSQSMDVVDIIQKQFAEIQRLQIKKSYLLKEVSQYLKD